jgi:endonuclease/exonuclease/phosphatase (EEP) superfamily protein YafD
VSVVGTWNCKGGTLRTRAAKGVRAIIRTHHPDVIALAECRGLALATIRARVALKHRVIAPRSYPWQDAALVIRRRCKVARRGVVRLDVPWTGPSGTRWRGKAIPWAVVDGVLYAAVHQVWNPRANESAAHAVLDALQQLAEDHDGPVCFLGDWNTSAQGLERFATHVGGRVVRGHGVDNAVVRLLWGKGEAGEKYGSDHAAVVYRLNAA